MRNGAEKSIPELMRDNDLLLEAMGRAVQKTVREHKLLGLPIVIWRDGKVVWVPPEEIELERRVSGCGQKVEGRLEVMFLAAAEIAVRLHLGEERRAGDRQLRPRGADSFGRELQVVVVPERRADELLQLRVLEDLPPGKIGVRRTLSLGLATLAQITVTRRNLSARSMVAGTDGAPGG